MLLLFFIRAHLNYIFGNKLEGVGLKKKVNNEYA